VGRETIPAKERQRRVNPLSERHIHRRNYASNRSPGWVVRMFRREADGVYGVTKFFGDRTYGSTELALAAARAFRERAAKALRPSRSPADGAGARKPPGRGKVTRVSQLTPHGLYEAWLVRFVGDETVRKYFAIKRWGEEGARALAEQWLRQQQRAWRKENRS